MTNDIIPPKHLPGHEHKYFPMDKMATFEPISNEWDERDLYERIEYVIMTCNCGDVIKKKVRDQ